MYFIIQISKNMQIDNNKKIHFLPKIVVIRWLQFKIN